MKHWHKILFSMICVFSVICMQIVPVYAWDRTQTPDKKGLQGADVSPVYQELGVHHTLYNVNITDLLAKAGQGEGYNYGGKTYYFNLPHLTPAMVTEFNRQGISVSVVLLMPWSEENQDLIYPNARKRGYPYYALNTVNMESKMKIAALFHFLGEKYSNDNCHVDNWILGNEVNMPNHYNYTGSLDLETNVQAYADAFLLLYRSMRNFSNSSRIFLSLDHSWTHNDEGRGIAGKDFLDRFAQVIEKKEPGCQWNLAYHAYAPIMTDSHIWLPSVYSTKSLNTPFISADNLEVLTGYVKKNFGTNHRIILSEQGFTATVGEDVQAAAICYTYLKAEFDDMVDAVIFRSLRDEVHEVASGFQFGIMNGATGRAAYNVFKTMGTEDTSKTDVCLKTIGISSWNQIIKQYNNNSFTGNNAVQNTMNGIGKYTAVFDPEYYLQNNLDVVRAFGYDYTAASKHFLTYGINEGRQANAAFSPSYYKNQYADLQAAFGNEWWRYYEHYITHGIGEGRKGIE